MNERHARHQSRPLKRTDPSAVEMLCSCGEIYSLLRCQMRWLDGRQCASYAVPGYVSCGWHGEMLVPTTASPT